MPCPVCGSATTDRTRFCGECGTPLSDAPSSPERKLVTTLFCDVVGSTAMGERLDPEIVDGMLRAYDVLAREAIHERGGTVEKFIGDAVVAVFGLPVAREDDAQRAVLAALAIVERLRRSELDLQVRIAVNTGEAFVRPEIAPSSGEGRATGDVFNAAARLQSSADPMTVVVGSRTAAMTAGTFLLQRLDDATVKGKAQPVQRWRVAGVAAAPHDVAASVPFVGREPELHRLRSAIERTAAGAGGLVLVEGDAGIGKSRLVREARIASSGVTWLTGRGSDTRDAVGYRPFREVLLGWVGGEGVGFDALAAAGTAIGLTEEDLPPLAALVGIGTPPDVDRQVSDLDPEAIRPLIFRSVLRWLEALTATGPVVLELEDWHWSDDASVRLAAHVLPLVARVPLAIIAVTRTDAAASAALREAARMHELDGRSTILALGPLDERASAAVAASTGGSDLPPERRSAATARAEGNPYFLQELVRFMTEHEVDVDALPDTVRAVVSARVDRLDPSSRTVLRAAAVLGRSFAPELVQRLAEDGDVDRTLRELAGRGLVAATASPKWRFSHALTRDTVYRHIPLAERRRLHRVAADALRGGGAPALPALAYHLAKAEDWDEASTALVAAGEHAARIASDDEALEMFREAIRAHEQLPEDRWSPIERSRIERNIADALMRLGRHVEATDQLRSALGRLGVRLPGSAAALHRATVPHLARRLHGPPPLPGTGESPSELELEIERELDLLGYIAYFYDSALFAFAGLLLTNRAARSGSPEGLGLGACACAVTFTALGRRKLARAYGERAMQVAERLSDPVQEARIVNGVALVPFALGDATEARDALQHGMRVSERAGDLRAWSQAAAALAWTESLAGDVAPAADLADQMLETARESGDPLIEAYGRAARALAHFSRQHPAGAQPELERALTLARQLPDQIVETIAAAGLVRVRLRLGDPRSAAAMLDPVREKARAQGLKGFPMSVVTAAELEWATMQLALDPRHRSTDARRAIRRARRDPGVCSWQVPYIDAMEATVDWLTGRRARAQRRLDGLAQAARGLGYPSVSADGVRWLTRCCDVAGVDPPPAEAALARTSA